MNRWLGWSVVCMVLWLLSGDVFFAIGVWAMLVIAAVRPGAR